MHKQTTSATLNTGLQVQDGARRRKRFREPTGIFIVSRPYEQLIKIARHRKEPDVLSRLGTGTHDHSDPAADGPRCLTDKMAARAVRKAVI